MRFYYQITFALIVGISVGIMRPALACNDGPPPPAVVITNTKVTPSCLHVSESFIQIRPNEPPEMGFGCLSHYASAIAIENTCSDAVTIEAINIKTEKTARHPIAFNEALQNNGGISLDNKIYLFARDGKTCDGSTAPSFVSFFEKLFGEQNETVSERSRCNAITLPNNETVKIVVPHNSSFTVSGTTGRKILKVAGSLIDPEDPDQALSYFLSQPTADKKARSQLMTLYRRKGDYKEFYRLLAEVAEEGEYSAQASLGIAYTEGKEIEKNCKKAKEWLAKSLVNVEKKIIEEEPTNYRIAESRRDNILRELAYTLAFKCGHDFKSAISLLRKVRDEAFFTARLHEAESGNVSAQKTILNIYRYRANDFQRSANFWLKLATGNKAIEWKNAEELNTDAPEHKLASTPAKKTDVMKFNEGGLATLSRLNDTDLNNLDAAVDGNISAQYQLSRTLFVTAVKNYEEFYFWRIWSQDTVDDSYEAPDYPNKFLTTERIAAQRKRAENWRASR